MLIPKVDNSKIFIWSYLLLEELVMSPINSPKGITIVEEKPYGCSLINIDRRAVLRQYYGKDASHQGCSNVKRRYSYGYNNKNLSVNTDPMNSVTKPFSYYLLNISKAVHEILVSRRHELNLDGVDLSTPFNHCTTLLYYADKCLKPKSHMAFHCDVSYTHKGHYIDALNEQVEGTPSVIITLGDTRRLNWKKQICMVNHKTGHLKWFDMEKEDFCKSIELSDKTITIVNTLDEKPVIDPNYGCMIRYQHGNVSVTNDTLSCGLVLRVVKKVNLYNSYNQLVTGIDNRPLTSVSSVDVTKHEKFHKGIRSLFKRTFASYRQER